MRVPIVVDVPHLEFRDAGDRIECWRVLASFAGHDFDDIGIEADRSLLKEVRNNLIPGGRGRHLTWGTGALASTVKLKPKEKAEIRFTLSWYFPHHLARDGREMGHMYANWYGSASEVNTFLCAQYRRHRAATEKFARTLTETSCGDAMAFAWSSQMSTLVVNTALRHARARVRVTQEAQP